MTQIKEINKHGDQIDALWKILDVKTVTQVFFLKKNVFQIIFACLFFTKLTKTVYLYKG